MNIKSWWSIYSIVDIIYCLFSFLGDDWMTVSPEELDRMMIGIWGKQRPPPNDNKTNDDPHKVWETELEATRNKFSWMDYFRDHRLWILKGIKKDRHFNYFTTQSIQNKNAIKNYHCLDHTVLKQKGLKNAKIRSWKFLPFNSLSTANITSFEFSNSLPKAYYVK